MKRDPSIETTLAGPAGRPGTLPGGVALETLTRVPFALVLTDPHLPDDPIVWVNPAFERTTGYAANAAVGRNCRFLQGPDTDPADVEKIRAALDERREATVDILNYRADGRPFWNRLMIAPMHDEAGRLTHFLGVQLALGAEHDRPKVEGANLAMREVQHRVKNHLAMVAGIVRMQRRHPPTEATFDTIARRIESLQHLYEELGSGQGDTSGMISLGAHVSRVASSIAHLDGRAGIRINIDCDAVEVPVDMSVKVGLLASELVTNAFQHAFEDTERGAVEVRVKELEPAAIRLEVADDGAGLPEGSAWPDGGNLGSRIIRQLAASLGAELRVTHADPGTIITVDVPRNRPHS